MGHAQTGYSTLDSNFLCQRCQHGAVMEGPGGFSRVLCHRFDGAPLAQRFVVTRCSEFQRPEAARLWPDIKTIPIFRIEDGELHVQGWNPQKGRYDFRPAREVYAEGKPKAVDGDGDLVLAENGHGWRTKLRRFLRRA